MAGEAFGHPRKAHVTSCAAVDILLPKATDSDIVDVGSPNFLRTDQGSGIYEYYYSDVWLATVLLKAIYSTGHPRCGVE